MSTPESAASEPIDVMSVLGHRGVGELAEKMGIEFLELTPEHSVATMPAEGNRQPYGIVHGGAYVVLAESMGSIAANLYAGPGRVAMGIEVNASHSGSAREGIVTGTCRALKLGRTLTTHQIEITDESGRLLSTVRITNFIRDDRR
ncbi:PaaI family thioesterase [Cnuibacter physcomitrellae]|uniref:PaaI family thioesterase n=1 Tax=Cnuibacter physcomitrellae TaxID=1619308 RepID=UPI002175B578|nr:PaaI family thioesterase [Cnuibacter physcomitrellae]MCS5496927.1 PaaI family thioesterase [Cnuibacter physcomitrellae]